MLSESAWAQNPTQHLWGCARCRQSTCQHRGVWAVAS